MLNPSQKWYSILLKKKKLTELAKHHVEFNGNALNLGIHVRKTEITILQKSTSTTITVTSINKPSHNAMISI